MLSDPYLDVIRKTQSPALRETLIENAIHIVLKKGFDKTFHDLLRENNVPDAEVSKLKEVIKKEFRASYRDNTLYTGVFMLLFLFISVILYWFGGIGFFAIFTSLIFFYMLYLFILSLAKFTMMK